MARKPRFHRAGAFFHVMLRGNNGQPIFFSDMDRCRLCLLIQQGTERFGYSVHGFCFMTNHIHLILKMGEMHISKAIQYLAFRYSRYINRKEKRVGHLFQGRFKANLVDSSEYLLELIRYVHLNPVRANLIKHPEEYRWSGHRSFLGLETITWISTDHILRKFDSHEIKAKWEYANYIKLGISDGVQNPDLKYAPSEGKLLEIDKFIYQDSCRDSMPTYNLEELIDALCRELNINKAVMFSPGKQRLSTTARGIAAILVKDAPHLTLKELADLVGQDLSTLSKLANRTAYKSESDPLLSTTISSLKQQLNQNQIAKNQGQNQGQA